MYVDPNGRAFLLKNIMEILYIDVCGFRCMCDHQTFSPTQNLFKCIMEHFFSEEITLFIPENVNVI